MSSNQWIGDDARVHDGLHLSFSHCTPSASEKIFSDDDDDEDNIHTCSSKINQWLFPRANIEREIQWMNVLDRIEVSLDECRRTTVPRCLVSIEEASWYNTDSSPRKKAALNLFSVINSLRALNQRRFEDLYTLKNDFSHSDRMT